MQDNKGIQVDVVVLAGRANTGRLKEISEETQEALIQLAGRPQVEYVLDALVEARCTREIVLVAPDDLDGLLRPGIRRVPVVGDMLGNLKEGLNSAQSDWVLIATSDIPLLKGDMVDEFLQDCFSQPGASVYMPVVPADVLESFNDDMKRTYGRVREGRYTGGNLFLIKRVLPPHVWERAEEFVAARKSVLRLASLLGLGFILRMLLWPPSIEQLEQRIGELVGLSVKAVPSTCPQLAVDCDKPSDYEVISALLQGQTPAGEGIGNPEQREQ